MPPSTEDDSPLLANPLTLDEALGRRPNTYFGRMRPPQLARWRAYPTPPDTPPAALLSATIQRPENEPGSQERLYEAFAPWKAAFLAGTRMKQVGTLQGEAVDKEKIKRFFQSKNKEKLPLHKDLPPPPSRHEQLRYHPYGEQFEQAERDHLKSHEPMNSWTKIDRFGAKDAQILDCMWVYVYKFDKEGRAATLAARSFRTFMAIAARFDLELKQFDAVNAFVNANLEEEVFMRMPPGYRERCHQHKRRLVCLSGSCSTVREE